MSHVRMFRLTLQFVLQTLHFVSLLDPLGAPSTMDIVSSRTWTLVAGLLLVTTPTRPLLALRHPVVPGVSENGVRTIGTTLAPPELVFPGGSSPGSCDKFDLPDMPARAWRGGDGAVRLVASWATTRTLSGPSLGTVKRDCRVVFNSTMSGLNSLYADHEWLIAPYLLPDNHTVFALMHQEYHGWEHANCSVQPSSGAAVKNCWMVAITSSISRDGGRSFTHTATPPGHLVASAPLQYDPDHSEFGYGDPSGIFRHHRDGMFYMTMTSRTLHGVVLPGTVIMRSSTPTDLRSWRCWNGTSFSVAFVDPYAMPRPSPTTLSSHVCAPMPSIGRNYIVLCIKFSTFFQEYVAVGEGFYTFPNGTCIHAYVYSLSTNGDVTLWSKPYLIRPRKSSPGIGVNENYASILDDTSSSRNFETVGRSAWFYYTRQTRVSNTSDPCGQGPFCRDLMRQRIVF